VRRAVRVKLDFVVEVDDDGCGVPFIGDVTGTIAQIARIVVPTATALQDGGRLQIGLTRASSLAARRVIRRASAGRAPALRSEDDRAAPDDVDPDLDDPDLARRDFDRVWRAMAEEGGCDVQGGEQYRRVRSEWLEEGRPENMREFIRRRVDPGLGAERMDD